MLLTKFSLIALLAGLPVRMCATAMVAEVTSPSSSQSPYIVGSQPGVATISILTVGDAVNYKPHTAIPYSMVGIPDGLGAFDNDEDADNQDDQGDDHSSGGNRNEHGTFTLFMNHELGATSGVPRAHGFTGAFVSKWIIEKESLTVLEGEDLIKTAKRWDTATQSYLPLAGGFTRFCSGDLPPLSAFYNKKTKLGYNGRIYMNGEEAGTEGRAFAHFLDGNSFELPALGKFSWENSVANPATGDKTIVVGTDDNAIGGQVYIYAGDKSSSPDSLAAAGLKNGILFAIKVTGLVQETDATAFTTGAFSVVSLGNVTALTGAQLEAATQAAGATSFNRPEDSCWDPSNPKDLYFVTTASFPNPAVPGSGKSRLWRLRFVDPAQPNLGGTAAVLLDGTTGPKMMDNITVSRRGSILIQEDVGNQPHIGKIWRYTIATGALELVAQHDPARFTPGSPGFLTQDEESSGIIPMDDILGEGWFLLDVQAHYAIPGELVEGGQLLGLYFSQGREKK